MKGILMRRAPPPQKTELAVVARDEGTSAIVLPPVVVLDTNVVFDWLLFADPACAPLRDAIERRQVHWIATTRMRDECFHVIGRGALDAWSPNVGMMEAAWAEHCSIVALPTGGASPGAPRCSDADDQMYIDLAIARRARWLLSKDRAVLRLAARLARCGTVSVSPAAWAKLQRVVASTEGGEATRAATVRDDGQSENAG